MIQVINDVLTVVEKTVNGLSAYEIAVRNGFSGSEQDWLDSLGLSSADIPAGYLLTSDGDGGLVWSKPTMTIGTKSQSINVYTSVPAATEETVVNVATPCVIDHLVFSCNRVDKLQLRILRVENGVEVSLGDAKPDGSSSYGFIPNQMNTNRDGLFEVLEYDTTANTYKFQLRQPLYCPEGVKVNRKNIDSFARNCAVVAWIRTFE